jgi:periplasmic protein TonB
VENTGENRDRRNLDDLAFTGRNLEYGAFYLRRRYRRFLTVSHLLSILIFFLLFLVPFAIYYFKTEPVDDNLYEFAIVDAMPMPPPENPDLLSGSLPKPPAEETPPPVPSDSVKELPKEKDLVEEQQPENTDTAGKSKTGTGIGEEGNGENSLYTVLDVYPRFPGGDQARLYFLRTHIRYPDAALKAGVQGVVVLVFVIEVDGSVSNVQIAKGIGGGCDDEAVRVVKAMPPWDPGKRSGRAVRVLVRMPIVFRIPGK